MSDKIKVLKINKNLANSYENNLDDFSNNKLWFDENTGETLVTEFDNTMEFKSKNVSKIDLVQNANSHFFAPENSNNLNFNKSDIENKKYESINLIDKMIMPRRSDIRKEIIDMRVRSYENEKNDKEYLLNQLNNDSKMPNNFRNYNLAKNENIVSNNNYYEKNIRELENSLNKKIDDIKKTVEVTSEQINEIFNYNNEIIMKKTIKDEDNKLIKSSNKAQLEINEKPKSLFSEIINETKMISDVKSSGESIFLLNDEGKTTSKIENEQLPINENVIQESTISNLNTQDSTVFDSDKQQASISELNVEKPQILQSGEDKEGSIFELNKQEGSISESKIEETSEDKEGSIFELNKQEGSISESKIEEASEDKEGSIFELNKQEESISESKIEEASEVQLNNQELLVSEVEKTESIKENIEEQKQVKVESNFANATEFFESQLDDEKLLAANRLLVENKLLTENKRLIEEKLLIENKLLAENKRLTEEKILMEQKFLAEKKLKENELEKEDSLVEKRLLEEKRKISEEQWLTERKLFIQNKLAEKRRLEEQGKVVAKDEIISDKQYMLQANEIEIEDNIVEEKTESQAIKSQTNSKQELDNIVHVNFEDQNTNKKNNDNILNLNRTLPSADLDTKELNSFFKEDNNYSLPVINNSDYTIANTVDDLQKAFNNLENRNKKDQMKAKFFEKDGGTTQLVESLQKKSKENKKKEASKSFDFDSFENWYNDSKVDKKISKLTKKELKKKK
ncbi:coiled-coil domain-containing protein [Spiroplasma cantharicola]|uniref:Uncharacterized protein n=1 Tax=Spiroplasma cantharicola TaxID=362837 RepID=A0A0M4K115_9MOLU|nr:hypothetical protein [Spiroplasma cantharicola]ALD66225.1 hypothetical protein SCANT_v1c03150 [Spiroplasma cantharicola]